MLSTNAMSSSYSIHSIAYFIAILLIVAAAIIIYLYDKKRLSERTSRPNYDTFPKSETEKALHSGNPGEPVNDGNFGEPINYKTSYCKNCGTRLEINATFCENCGESV